MCPAVERIDLTKAGNLCSESSSMVGMTCQVTITLAIIVAITTLAITVAMCRAPGTLRR